MNVRVTAPYVTLRVRDNLGAWTVRGLYAGAVVPKADVDAESLRHHLDSDLVALVAADSPAQAPEPTELQAPLVDSDDQGPIRPADNANKPVWVEYAVLMRADDVSEEDARSAAEAMSKADLIKQFG